MSTALPSLSTKKTSMFLFRFVPKKTPFLFGKSQPLFFIWENRRLFFREIESGSRKKWIYSVNIPKYWIWNNDRRKRFFNVHFLKKNHLRFFFFEEEEEMFFLNHSSVEMEKLQFPNYLGIHLNISLIFLCVLSSPGGFGIALLPDDRCQVSGQSLSDKFQFYNAIFLRTIASINNSLSLNLEGEKQPGISSLMIKKSIQKSKEKQ